MVKLLGGRYKVCNRTIFGCGRALFAFGLMYYASMMLRGKFIKEQERINFFKICQALFGLEGVDQTVFEFQYTLIALGLFASGALCFLALRKFNLLGGFLGLLTMLYYILFNLNPFFHVNQDHHPYLLLEDLMKNLFIEYLSILGVFVFIIANASKSKN